MAVRIRLTRKGRKKQPFYRIVVADSEAPRDGKFLDIVGTYDPMQNPAAVTIDNEKLALCLVVQSGTGLIEAAAFGTTEDAWAATAAVAAESHIVYTDQPYTKMLAMMPTRYRCIQKTSLCSGCNPLLKMRAMILPMNSQRAYHD